jgi:DNA-binding SARP family transcriptional activator/TolB-like protein
LTAQVPRCNVNLNVLRLITFGGLGLVSNEGSAAPRLRPPRLALLAALAAAGERGISRERLMAFFWPDSDETHGRHSLRQALYALRQELDCDVVASNGATLTLDARCIRTDVAEFREALAADELSRAVGIARGPFLDGFYLPSAAEFERWVEEERTRLTSTLVGALMALASDAEAEGDYEASTEWWDHLTKIDPLSGRFAVGYLETLAVRGDRATALAFIRQHEMHVRRELDAEPDPEVRRIEAKLRAATPVENERAVPERAVERASPPAIINIPQAASSAMPNAWGPPRRLFANRVMFVAGVAVLATLIIAAVTRGRTRPRDPAAAPVFAVGLIREDGLPDSAKVGRVLTDMLATNLARVEGLAVLANSRLIELMGPGQDSSAAAYMDAARRAGATELFEGTVRRDPSNGLALEIRRVELRTGVVRRAYRVTAADRYAVIDDVTRVIAGQLARVSPSGSIADATTASPVAYRLYEEGLRAYYLADEKTARRLMRAALEEDSTFALAAYYEALLAVDAGQTPTGRHPTVAMQIALDLARRAPERERLTIAADLSTLGHDPHALAVAESLATRYPDDPRAQLTLGKVRMMVGDFPGAAAATDHAIRLDSVAETKPGATCHLCKDFYHLAQVYQAWDSLAASERTMRRYRHARPDAPTGTGVLAILASRRGDSTEAYARYREALAAGEMDRAYKLHLDVALGEYDTVERDVRSLLASSSLEDWGRGAWLYLIALRNQGRLREAAQFHRTGTLPGMPPLTARRPAPDVYNEGIIAFERGEPRVAAAVFKRFMDNGFSEWPPGTQARHRTWMGTLQGMALSAAGDTAALRALADTVEALGQRSVYGRDVRSHHYLRGLLFAAQGRYEDAVREYRAAIWSPALGFTRVNYELARCLLRLGRPAEAVATLQSALSGEIDSSNLYITRTELHELLAQAFDAAKSRDSAAFHYRAVAQAWSRADPMFVPRRSAATEWLARHSSSPVRAIGDQ